MKETMTTKTTTHLMMGKGTTSFGDNKAETKAATVIGSMKHLLQRPDISALQLGAWMRVFEKTRKSGQSASERRWKRMLSRANAMTANSNSVD